jgi:hypothetical protein
MVRASSKMKRQPSPIESLAAAIAARKVILFVGGGISQYLGTAGLPRIDRAC